MPLGPGAIVLRVAAGIHDDEVAVGEQRPRSRGSPARADPPGQRIRARGSKRRKSNPSEYSGSPDPRSRNQCRSSAQKSGMNMPPEWLATISAGPFVGRCSKPQTSASKYAMAASRNGCIRSTNRGFKHRQSRPTGVQPARRGGRQRKDDGARPRSDARSSTGPLCSKPSRPLSACPVCMPRAEGHLDYLGLDRRRSLCLVPTRAQTPHSHVRQVDCVAEGDRPYL